MTREVILVPLQGQKLVRIYFKTRSYYRKENAASPPRAGTMRNLLNKGGSLCDTVSPGRDQYEEG